ncbi:retron Ec67 family RNA-directed DNA polymerase/endonuclease [Lachnospiraceae bacterium 62-26]|uniref:retron Ec67 family RNA-directed DNA polymerase/endonuclease n=1 Tax=Schaedlerella arabinosiphila TaxID=2044587 RepID=UPI0025581B18|nr:retron Ec67 family RNA-directed DNA polymerase/endonuclease [Schaedlerella arabinosiphila]
MINEIKNRNELADFLAVPRKKLTYILYVKKIDNYYTSFDISKKNGGVRHIYAPYRDLKNIQRKIGDALWKYQKEIWKKNNINPIISHGFEKGKSILTNAKVHRDKKYVMNIDLENFFDCFHFGRVRGFFQKNINFQLSKEVSTVLAQLVCYNGKLPQGAPSSPIITNMICNIFDIRIAKLAKKYKLNYTRYADDLTFSTNDKKFIERYKEFYQELLQEIEKAGFIINTKKTRLFYKDSRQEVTGLVVNKRINVNRDYYKETRAMAHELYKKGVFQINGDEGTIHQLEGRFSFINQAVRYNNILDSENHSFYKLNGREKQYKQFLFYKYFFSNPKPLIVTEGKTDIVYIKAALKNLYKEYPQLIIKNEKGQFEYKISFLRKTKRLEYFLNIRTDGADTMKNIYQYYLDKGDKNYPNYLKVFKQLREGGGKPSNAVILLFDNELNSKERPVYKFINDKLVKLNDSQKKELAKEERIILTDNLFLLVTPAVPQKEISDIEDLFDEATLNTEINGKHFSKDDKYDINLYYGKDTFSKYIMKNYENIDFCSFKRLLDNIKMIISTYGERVKNSS